MVYLIEMKFDFKQVDLKKKILLLTRFITKKREGRGQKCSPSYKIGLKEMFIIYGLFNVLPIGDWSKLGQKLKFRD